MIIEIDIGNIFEVRKIFLKCGKYSLGFHEQMQKVFLRRLDAKPIF